MQGCWLLGTGGSVVPAPRGGWAGAKALMEAEEGRAGKVDKESPVRCRVLNDHY